MWYIYSEIRLDMGVRWEQVACVDIATICGGE